MHVYVQHVDLELHVAAGHERRALLLLPLSTVLRLLRLGVAVRAARVHRSAGEQRSAAAGAAEAGCRRKGHEQWVVFRAKGLRAVWPDDVVLSQQVRAGCGPS